MLILQNAMASIKYTVQMVMMIGVLILSNLKMAENDVIVVDGATGELVTKQGREKVAAAKKLCGVF
jgi:hypothetical protein